MELYEVLAPHVTIPVLCVLIFAFIVFAFGFKTPAQPPSFSFGEEQKDKQKKNKKSKEKSKSSLHSNGQMQVSPEEVLSSKPVSKVTSSTVIRHKSPDLEQTKNSTIVKKVAQGKQEPAVDDNQGEWTTFVSRKEKKQRNKKDEDDEVERNNVGVNSEKKSDTASPGKGKNKKMKKPIVAETCEDAGVNECETGIAEVTPAVSKDTHHAPEPVVVPPPAPIFDVEIDIQSVDKKPAIDVAALQLKLANKSPKKKKKDKKEKSPAESIKPIPNKNSSVQESSDIKVIPDKGSNAVDDHIKEEPQKPVPKPSVTPTDNTMAPSEHLIADGFTDDEKPKAKKRKARREN